ncbi:MAG: orotate phosphoribosyltransferase [Eubacterium sp.]|jgi:orotate phosphoribosyltransferase|nr:orotate phosphoribosyltransferase [Eubacterium sp.]
MLTNAYKVTSTSNNKIQLKVLPGHFATSHSHINFYLDMTRLKVGQRESKDVASTLARDYQYNKPVDCIICMDGCYMIGAYLAEQLSDAGVISMNMHKSIYVIEPEFDSNGQMIFRDNIQPMVRGKNIVLLLASATTGKTIAQSLECIRYYGGIIQGISAIFSATDTIEDYPVHTIFHTDDFVNYQSYSPHDCPFCQSGQKIDAIVNNFGYSQL